MKLLQHTYSILLFFSDDAKPGHLHAHSHDTKPQFYTTEPSNISIQIEQITCLKLCASHTHSFTHQYWGCQVVSIWDMNTTFIHIVLEQIRPNTRTTCRHSFDPQSALEQMFYSKFNFLNFLSQILNAGNKKVLHSVTWKLLNFITSVNLTIIYL